MESRPVGANELSWCRAVPGGTGITVVALLFNKQPDMQILQSVVHEVQNYHSILRSKLHLDARTKKFSFVTPSVSGLQVKLFDLESTLRVVEVVDETISPFQMIVEHELNLNPWENSSKGLEDYDVMEAKVYEMEGGKWTMTLKAHTAACDRTASDTVLREVVRLLVERGVESGIGGKGEVKMGIEDYIPGGKGKKSLWTRGVNMLGYSLNAFRLSNIEFVDTRSRRRTQLASLRLEPEVTNRLLEGCKIRGMMVWGVLAAAALMGARRIKATGKAVGQTEKYSVASLVDCRSLLDPPLSRLDVGSYHSAIVNTHDINGKERLWELAERIYNSSKTAKDGNKHFSDMADLSFLMCRAIENPGLTPSSSLRTSFLSVFEDVPTHEEPDYKAAGVVDYVATSSLHGVGPTLAIFAEIRDGGLSCSCAYPGPLHSRDQIQTRLLRSLREREGFQTGEPLKERANLQGGGHQLATKRTTKKSRTKGKQPRKGTTERRSGKTSPPKPSRCHRRESRETTIERAEEARAIQAQTTRRKHPTKLQSSMICNKNQILGIKAQKPGEEEDNAQNQARMKRVSFS